MFKKERHPLVNISLTMFIFIVFFYILSIGSSFIIPFIIAILFSFAIISLSNFYKKFKLPAFLAFTLSIGTYIFMFWLIGKMIGSNIEDLVRLLPTYQEKVSGIITSVFEYFNITQFLDIREILSKVDLQNIFALIVGGVTAIFSSTGIIMFYVLFILLEYRHFREKLNRMFSDEHKRKEISETIDRIKHDIKSYFVIKSVVSFITASLSYLVMVTFDLDFAIFWAFLVFLLNFIPSIGSVIAVSFPILLSLVQFDSYYPFIFIASGLVGIQVLMGNIIEPRFMGNKLNLSPLVIILALGFWGTIWGVVGMLLSVPIMVILNIIFAKIPATRSLAILLSEKGELQVDSGEEVLKNRKKLIDKVKNRFTKKKK